MCQATLMHSPVCLRARPWSNRRVADGAPQAATLRPRAASSVMNSRLFKRLNSVCLRGSRTAPHSTQNSVSRSGVSVTYFAVRPENRGMSGSHQLSAFRIYSELSRPHLPYEWGGSWRWLKLLSPSAKSLGLRPFANAKFRILPPQPASPGRVSFT
jgi:hypothetical protein